MTDQPTDPFAKPPGYGPPPEQPAWGPPSTPGAPPPPAQPGWGPPPGPPSQDQLGWGAPQQQWSGGQPQTETKAVIALVLAIAAYTFVPFIAAIAAIVLARMAKRDIEASGGRLTGAGMATWAFWLGVVHLVFVVLFFLAIVLLAVGGVAFS